MRPQVGKRALNMEQTAAEKPKTRSRIFVESKLKYNLATKEDYLTMRNVAAAINMNALEQRVLTKENILKLLKKGISMDRLVEKLEHEIQIDQHRLTKYFG